MESTLSNIFVDLLLVYDVYLQRQLFRICASVESSFVLMGDNLQHQYN